MLHNATERGKMLLVEDGFLVCPVCLRNKHLKRIGHNERGENIVCYCRSCKQETVVDIEQGQCYMSRSQ